MRRSLLLPLLLACRPPDEGQVREAGTDDTATDSGADSGADTSEDSGSGDSGEDSDTDTGADPGEPTGCATTSDARGRCVLETEADWAGGDWAGILAQTELSLFPDGTGTSTGTDSAGDMNGGAYRKGTWTSGVLEPGIDFDGIVPSWIARTPAGTWITIHVQARVSGAWTDWYRLGVWASNDTVDRHSYAGESDGDGTVYTDTVLLRDAADAARISVSLYTEDDAVTPTVSRLALALADTGAGARSARGGEAWGVDWDVPERSQMEFAAGEAWCSPTSTSMILAWHAEAEGRSDWDVSVPTAADGTWDHVYEGNGNWPFNTAYAGALGLRGEVGWFDSLADLEPWIATGHPVALSVAWDAGELDNAPISSTNGHLIVLRGFEADGDAVVNDPAAPSDSSVTRVYDRDQLENVWMGGSGGIAYLIWPAGPRPVP